MVIVAVLLIVGGVLVGWLGWLGRNGRLTRNAWAGIRTRTTMQSDGTWTAAHRAGGGWIIVGGIVMIATGVAMLLTDDDTTASIVALVGTFGLFVLVLIGGWLGQQAAKRSP